MATTAEVHPRQLPQPKNLLLPLQRQLLPPRRQRQLQQRPPVLPPQQALVLAQSMVEHALKHMLALVLSTLNALTESGSCKPVPPALFASFLEMVPLLIAIMLVAILRFAVRQTRSMHSRPSLLPCQQPRAKTLRLLLLLMRLMLTLPPSRVSSTFAALAPRLLETHGLSPLPLQAVKLLVRAPSELSVNQVIL